MATDAERIEQLTEEVEYLRRRDAEREKVLEKVTAERDYAHEEKRAAEGDAQSARAEAQAAEASRAQVVAAAPAEDIQNEKAKSSSKK